MSPVSRTSLFAFCIVVLLCLLSPLALADDAVPPSVADLKQELLLSRDRSMSDSVVVAPPGAAASSSAPAVVEGDITRWTRTVYQTYWYGNWEIVLADGAAAPSAG